jgi:2'-5' RNA ligase
METDLPAPSPGSPELIRAFYAIRLSPAIDRYLAGIIAELRRYQASVSWTPDANLHITLRFLGDITVDQLEQARSYPAMEETHSGFDLRAEGLGAFPLLRAPRIFWAGVAGGTGQDIDRLLHLQGRTEIWARRIGIPAENRRYSPHVTLGRVRRPFTALRELTDDIIGRTCHSETCHVGELLLMRSTLTPKGSIYEVERSWSLGV